MCIIHVHVCWYCRITAMTLKCKAQGTHCTGKTGKMAKKFPVRENKGNLEILPKHREFALLKL